MTAPAPWLAADPLPDAEFSQLRRRAIFEYNKWDPQIEDVCAVARMPLVMHEAAWSELVCLAEALAAETLEAETELLGRPGLHRRLGLPRDVTAALARVARLGARPGAARLIRFDFHYTAEGWRISEANSDVPGGLNEASGLAALVAPYYPGTLPAGDPAAAYVATLLAGSGACPRVALVHATAYSDDQQMMAFLARRLDAAGARAFLASPAHLRWRDGRAWLETDWCRGPLDLVVRFFPGEWLPRLPAACGWEHFFAGGGTPASNPASAVLTQSKRFPLVWDELVTALPAWRALLPETRDPREVRWQDRDDWVVKPALGRVGEDVGMPGLVAPQDRRRLEKAVARHPGHWVAQRRFVATPLQLNGTCVYPCVGVYTVGRRAVGAYGRLARRPLIDWRAEDAAVLVTAGRAGSPAASAPL